MVALDWESMAGAARAGDRGAENALMRSLEPYLHRLARSVLGPDEDDLCQVALLAVWRGLPRYDPARPFKQWARVVAKRAMLSAVRGHREAVGFEDGCGYGVTFDADHEDRTAGLPAWWVHEVMGGLDDRDRAAAGQRFGLVGARERTVTEVAATQGRPRPKASAGLSDALAAMRVAFEVRYGGPCT